MNPLLLIFGIIPELYKSHGRLGATIIMLLVITFLVVLGVGIYQILTNNL